MQAVLVKAGRVLTPFNNRRPALGLENVHPHGAPVGSHFTTAAAGIRTYQVQCDRMIA